MTETLLQRIEKEGEVVLSAEHNALVKSLEAHNIVTVVPFAEQTISLSEEGAQAASNGSPEFRVLQHIRMTATEAGLTKKDLEAALESHVVKIGMAKGFALGWLKKDGDRITAQSNASMTDITKTQLEQIRDTGKCEDANLLKELKKRQLVVTGKNTFFRLSKGPKFTLEGIKQQETDLTAELLASKKWKEASFKEYNLEAAGIPLNCGHLHPLMKVRQEFREIFFEMGFTEMPTNQFVESSFWNFDALFQPQQHPARDMHDTFFLLDPATDDKYPKDYAERVKNVHSKGGYGSVGYGYDWSYAEANKLIMRTHTTAVSSYMLYQLAQQKEFKATKLFSIDRVFRNETVDATHLAEFHQIEGLVADRGLTLGDLIGVLHSFFKKLGIERLKFKPAYNPYTEPSMEIFSFHNGLNRWVEIGNSGMFRPEMLRPLGLPEDVQVIAWGLSLERPTMIKYGIDNIRELLGHKVDLDMVKQNPICRLDKKMGREA